MLLINLGLEMIFSDGVTDCDPVRATIDLVPERSLLSRLLEKYTVGPLVGLEYVVEVLVGRSDPEYKCALCFSLHRSHED